MRCSALFQVPLFLATICCSALFVHAGTISYIPISSDADSGFDSAKTYTHAIDYGTQPAQGPTAVINGVTFSNGNPGAMPGPVGSNTVGTGSVSMPDDHAGNDNQNVTAGGLANLLRDMVYNDSTATVQLTGLTPGQRYDFRLYHREWAASGDRTQDFLFDGDGDFAFEDMANINEDDATDMPPGFATEDQAYFLSYVYTAGASGNLNLQINTETGEGTYHLYGLTNELTNELIVPEPGSIAIWALLGTLGAGVAYRRSRRRANRR